MRTRQDKTICLGEWIRPASADFPPAGRVWGGMRAGFGLGVFGNSAANQKLLFPDSILLPTNDHQGLGNIRRSRPKKYQRQV